jgi:hypothetical protein
LLRGLAGRLDGLVVGEPDVEAEGSGDSGAVAGAESGGAGSSAAHAG